MADNNPELIENLQDEEKQNRRPVLVLLLILLLLLGLSAAGYAVAQQLGAAPEPTVEATEEATEEVTQPTQEEQIVLTQEATDEATEQATEESPDEPEDEPEEDEPTPTTEPTLEFIPIPPPVVCGDGVCQSTENQDVCPQDCGCFDDGIVSPAEAGNCGCQDVLCPDESLESSCGSACGPGGTCGGGFTCTGGICWDSATCDPPPPDDPQDEGPNCSCQLAWTEGYYGEMSYQGDGCEEGESQQGQLPSASEAVTFSSASVPQAPFEGQYCGYCYCVNDSQMKCYFGEDNVSSTTITSDTCEGYSENN